MTDYPKSEFPDLRLHNRTKSAEFRAHECMPLILWFEDVALRNRGREVNVKVNAFDEMFTEAAARRSSQYLA